MLPLLAPNFVQVFSTPPSSHMLQGSWPQLHRWPAFPALCQWLARECIITHCWPLRHERPRRTLWSSQESLKIMLSCLWLDIVGSGTGVASCLQWSQIQYKRTGLPALPLFLFFCPLWSCDGWSSRGLLGLCGDSEDASFRQQSIEMEGAWVFDEFLKLPYQPCTADFLVTLMQ